MHFTFHFAQHIIPNLTRRAFNCGFLRAPLQVDATFLSQELLELVVLLIKLFCQRA